MGNPLLFIIIIIIIIIIIEWAECLSIINMPISRLVPSLAPPTLFRRLYAPEK